MRFYEFGVSQMTTPSANETKAALTGAQRNVEARLCLPGYRASDVRESSLLERHRDKGIRRPAPTMPTPDTGHRRAAIDASG